MTFFDIFMMIVGLFSMLTIIFWAVGRVDPEIRENEITEWLYDFLFNSDIDVYEQD